MPPDKRTANSDRMPPPPSRNISGSDGLKSSSQGLKRIWNNYKATLKNSFNEMSRTEQEDLIDKFAMIVTIGVACIVILVFYGTIPRLLRVLGLPVAILAAWWAGRRVVAPVIIERMSHLLKKREQRDDLIE